MSSPAQGSAQHSGFRERHILHTKCDGTQRLHLTPKSTSLTRCGYIVAFNCVRSPSHMAPQIKALSEQPSFDRILIGT